MEKESCSICLEDIAERPALSHEPRKLGCGHTFHKQCIYDWLEEKKYSQPSCPLCRDRLLTEKDWAVLLKDCLTARKGTALALDLIGMGRKQNYSFAKADEFFPLLLRAATSGAPWSVIEALLDAGQDPDGGDLANRFSARAALEGHPFHAAAFRAYMKAQTEKKTVETKKRPDDSDEAVYSALLEAIAAGDLASAKVALMELSTSSMPVIDPLHKAIETGRIDMVELVAQRFPPIPPKRMRPPHLEWAKQHNAPQEVIDFLNKKLSC